MKLKVNISVQKDILRSDGHTDSYRTTLQYISNQDINPNDLTGTTFPTIADVLTPNYGVGVNEPTAFKDDFIFRRWPWILKGKSLNYFRDNWTELIVPLVPGMLIIEQLDNHPYCEIIDSNIGEEHYVMNIIFKAVGINSGIEGKGVQHMSGDIILRDITDFPNYQKQPDKIIGYYEYQWQGRGGEDKQRNDAYYILSQTTFIRDKRIITDINWKTKYLNFDSTGFNAFYDTDNDRKYLEPPLTKFWNTTGSYNENDNGTGQNWGFYQLDNPLNNTGSTSPNNQVRGKLYLYYKEKDNLTWRRERQKIIQVKEFDENNRPLPTSIVLGTLRYYEKYRGDTLIGYEYINFDKVENDVAVAAHWSDAYGDQLYYTLKDGYTFTNGQRNIVLFTDQELLGSVNNPNRDATSFVQVKISKSTKREGLNFIIFERNGTNTNVLSDFSTGREVYYIGQKIDSFGLFGAYQVNQDSPSQEWDGILKKYVNFNITNKLPIDTTSLDTLKTSIVNMLSLVLVDSNRTTVGEIRVAPTSGGSANNISNYDVKIFLDTKTEVVNSFGSIKLKHVSPDTTKFPQQVDKTIGSFTFKANYTGITDLPQTITDVIITKTDTNVISNIVWPNWNLQTNPNNPPLTITYQDGFVAPNSINYSYDKTNKVLTIEYSEQYSKVKEDFYVRWANKSNNITTPNILKLSRYKYILHSGIEYTQFIEKDFVPGNSVQNISWLFNIPKDIEAPQFILDNTIITVNPSSGNIDVSFNNLKDTVVLSPLTIDYTNKIITVNYTPVSNQITQRVRIEFNTRERAYATPVREPLEYYEFTRQLYDLVNGATNETQHFKTPWQRQFSSGTQQSKFLDLDKLTLGDDFDNYNPIITYLPNTVTQTEISIPIGRQITGFSKVYEVLVTEILPQPDVIKKGIYVSIDNNTIYLGYISKNRIPGGILTETHYETNWTQNLNLQDNLTHITSLIFTGAEDEATIDSILVNDPYIQSGFASYSNGNGEVPNGYIITIQVATSQTLEKCFLSYTIEGTNAVQLGFVQRTYAHNTEGEKIYTNWDYSHFNGMVLELKEYVDFAVSIATIQSSGGYDYTYTGYKRDDENTHPDKNEYTYIFNFNKTSIGEINLVDNTVSSPDTNLMEEEIDKAFDDLNTEMDLIQNHIETLSGYPYPKLPNEYELALEGEHFQLVCSLKGGGATSTLVNGVNFLDTNTTGGLSYDLFKTNEVISVEDINIQSSLENPLNDIYFNKAKIPSQEYQITFRVLSECGKAHTIRDKVIESVATIWEQFDKQQFILNRLISPKYFECDYLSWGKLYLGKKPKTFKTLDGEYLHQTSQNEIDRYIQVVPTKIKRNLSQDDTPFNSSFTITFFAPNNVYTSEPQAIWLDQNENCIIDNPKTLFNAYANVEIVLQVKDKEKAKRYPNPQIRFDFLSNNGEIMKRHAIYFKNLGDIKTYPNQNNSIDEGSITIYMSDTFGFKNSINTKNQQTFKGVMWDEQEGGLGVSPDWFISSITGFEDGVLEFPYQNDYNYVLHQDSPNPEGLNEDYRVLSNFYGSLMDCNKLKISILNDTIVPQGAYDFSIRLLPKSII